MHIDYRENYPSAATELSPVCFTVVHVSRGGFSRPVVFFSIPYLEIVLLSLFELILTILLEVFPVQFLLK